MKSNLKPTPTLNERVGEEKVGEVDLTKTQKEAIAKATLAAAFEQSVYSRILNSNVEAVNTPKDQQPYHSELLAKAGGYLSGIWREIRAYENG